MKALIWLLTWICKFAITCPRLVLAVFVGLAIIGFCLLPSVKVSTNLVAGVGDVSPVINLTVENSALFGEQDSLIVVLEFPEPPGEMRRAIIEGVGKSLRTLPNVRRVVYRFLDPDNEEQITRLFKHFLRGMNDQEREAIKSIFTSQGMTNALGRNRNRLFMVQNPDLSHRILEDPLELGQFVSQSINKRVGNVSLGDAYLFIASPDSTMYLIQITPAIASADIGNSRVLLKRLNQRISSRLSEIVKAIPDGPKRFKDLKWHVTGKMAFHHESDVLFEKEMVFILLSSFLLVSAFLMFAYRRFSSVGLLMAPIAVAVGGNYCVIWLTYNEINPVVMGTTGILFGLGTDYGVHLWGRYKEELDKGIAVPTALLNVFQTAGPPVFLGAVTSVIAFLSLCLSRLPVMGQFGFVCATGVAIALMASLFMFPALAVLIEDNKWVSYPEMKARFAFLSTLFQHKPKVLVSAFLILIAVAFYFGLHLTYERDLLKVFMASGLKSMKVAEQISKKFQSNFAQPTLLSFDVSNLDRGVEIQRRVDEILVRLMKQEGEIATFDSVSYLTAPVQVQKKNLGELSRIVSRWPDYRSIFIGRMSLLDLSDSSVKEMLTAFDKVGKTFSELQVLPPGAPGTEYTDLERSWYQAKVDDGYRFLTKIRYSNKVNDPDELKAADSKMMRALSKLPVDVKISGPRQSMEALLETLVSELFRLGLLAGIFVVLFFLLIFRNPLGVCLSLVPMLGAFCVTLGTMGAFKIGIPFSIIGVAPIIFGLAIDNGIHIVMRSMEDKTISLDKVMKYMTPLITVTSLTTLLGFLSMVTSSQYAMEFLGFSLVIGMATALIFTLVPLPAFLLLLERRSSRSITGQ